jgi:hypothetical protein
MAAIVGADITSEEQGSRPQCAGGTGRRWERHYILSPSTSSSFSGVLVRERGTLASLVQGWRARSVSSVKKGRLVLGPGIAEEGITISVQ